MVDIYRMVARLGELVKDAHASTALGSCSEHRIAEISLVHHLRAGESEQDSTRLDLLECLCIELAITAEGIAQSITVLGKCRRIQDNQIVLVAHPVEVLERIFGVCLMARVAREVQFHILVGKVDGLGRAVHRVNEVGTTTHSVERETTGVAEHVQHVAPLGIAFQEVTVLL